MPDSPLTRKIGPLPAWGWLAAVTLGIILYYRHAQNAAASSSTGGTVYDPNAVDPTTGLTYGQEAQLALGGSGAPGGGQLTPTTGAGTDTTTTTSGPSWQDVIGGWSDIAGAWRDIATTQLTPPTNTVTQVPTDPKPPKTGAGKGKVWAWIGGKWEAIKNPNAKPPGGGKGGKGGGKGKPPGGHPGVGSAGKGKGKTTGGAKQSSNNRAPASSRENVHAQAQAHTTPPPARTRVTVRKPPPKPHNRPPARRR